MLAQRTIRRLIKFENYYHAIVQAYNGRIYHEKFKSESEAREFLKQFKQGGAVHVEEMR